MTGVVVHMTKSLGGFSELNRPPFPRNGGQIQLFLI